VPDFHRHPPEVVSSGCECIEAVDAKAIVFIHFQRCARDKPRLKWQVPEHGLEEIVS
jgi:hypothetical protein